MEDFLESIDFEGEIILNELCAWMDGGTITLALVDSHEHTFEVTICQTMSLKIHSHTGTWIPGAFLFNDIEVPIRSNSEQTLLRALKSFKFSPEIPLKNRSLEKEIIIQGIAFVESEEYLQIASQMGKA